MSYLIFTDVSADVATDLPENSEIGFVPMEYSIGGGMRKCESTESRQQLKLFYDGQRGGDLTQTSQISPYMYEEFFEPYMKEGNSILYLSLSSGLSSTFQSARMASAALKEKYPELDMIAIDSLGATGGMGVLIERARRNKEAGLSLTDNAADIKVATGKIRHWFMVEDLMYLKRGGRIGAASAVIGTALQVKPILKINEEGKLDIVYKKRGLVLAKKCIMEEFLKDYDAESGDVIYVTDADSIENGDSMKDMISEKYPNAVIRRTGLTPIIGAHTGPGMFAVCYIAK